MSKKKKVRQRAAVSRGRAIRFTDDDWEWLHLEATRLSGELFVRVTPASVVRRLIQQAKARGGS